jgi:hypothetical protein
VCFLMVARETVSVGGCEQPAVFSRAQRDESVDQGVRSDLARLSNFLSTRRGGGSGSSPVRCSCGRPLPHHLHITRSTGCSTICSRGRTAPIHLLLRRSRTRFARATDGSRRVRVTIPS